MRGKNECSLPRRKDIEIHYELLRVSNQVRRGKSSYPLQQLFACHQQFSIDYKHRGKAHSMAAVTSILGR